MLAGSRIPPKENPVVYKFYKGASVAMFDNIKPVLQNSPEGMDYSGTKKGEHDGGGVARTTRKLLLVLIKLRHNFPESDLGNHFTWSGSPRCQEFSRTESFACTMRLRFSIWLFCCVRLTTSTHDIDFKFSGVKECNKTRLKT